MEKRYRDRTAIVTGASRGIGRGIATRLGGEGARVVLCARDGQALAEAAIEIRESGGSAETIALDLRLPESSAQLVEFAATRFGSIDVLVNNAGATKRGDFRALADDDFADGFALKYFGTVRLTRAAWQHLRASHGSVIFIGGVGGWTPGAQFAVGGSVNAALLAFTKAVAEVGIADGVQVNLINPGTIRTARFVTRLERFAAERGIAIEDAERDFIADHRIARIGEPADIAALVAFVASPEGRLFHRSLIDMDAGATKSI